MKYLIHIALIGLVFSFLSCKPEEVNAPPTVVKPIEPEYKIIQVGNFKIDSLTLKNWVYNNKKKAIFTNAQKDTMEFDISSYHNKDWVYSEPTYPNSTTFYKFFGEIRQWTLRHLKDSFQISASIMPEPEMKENSDKVCDVLGVFAPNIEGKWYWGYVMYTVINRRNYNNKFDQTVVVPELTINGITYKNVSKATSVNYNKEFGIVSFYDTKAVQWSILSLK